MRIAIDVSQMCYSGTGVARYVFGLTKALLLSGTNHTFLLYAGALRQRAYFTTLTHTAPWDKAQWKIAPLPPKLARLSLNLFPLEYFTGPVDLIHASDWTEPYTKLPMVTTVHDLVFRQYPETVDPLILKAQTNRLNRLTNSTTHIIADSLSTKNDLIKIYNMESDRITVIYPGIDSIYRPATKKEIERVKTKYNLPDQFIFSLGTQEPRKNLSRLVDAVEGLHLPLVLAGRYGWGGSHTPRSLGAHTPGVSVLGFVPDEDLPGLYSAATVFAYPSLYEGFGFPVLEAMACGTPVVTSNVSSLPEVVGHAAVLVNPLNVSAISAGITQAIAQRKKLIALGRKQVKRFTWANTAQQVLEVYDKIAHRG